MIILTAAIIMVWVAGVQMSDDAFLAVMAAFALSTEVRAAKAAIVEAIKGRDTV